MPTIEKIKLPEQIVNTPAEKVSVFIIDSDVAYSKSLKNSLEKEFNAPLEINLFNGWDKAAKEIEIANQKPHAILLNYLSNKCLTEDSDKHTVDDILRVSPDTSIIMLSNKKDIDRAMKALAYGAQDLVVKDKFTHEHILNSLRKILNPSKV